MHTKGTGPIRLRFQWPSHVPNECPPDSAEVPNGVVFRTVANNPPKPSDFLAYIEEHPDGVYAVMPHPIHGVSSRFRASGVSVSRDYAHATKLAIGQRDRIPALRNAKIASGELTAAMGAVKATPSKANPSHVTWWIPLGVNPCDAFIVVNELDE